MAKKAVLLLNLGSPDSTSVPDVRRYLREFLSDERVIDSHPLVRWLVLNLFILPSRPKRSAEAYSQIWLSEGSPLIVTSKKQQALVQEKTSVPIALAMRYGNPSTPDVIRNLIADGVEELFIIPLYPHYAMSSWETALVAATDIIAKEKPSIRYTVLPPFYNDPEYIDALCASARPYLQEPYDKLIFSFHGIPERHLIKSDPSHSHCLSRPDCCDTCHPAHATCYRHQCFETVKLVANQLGLSQDTYTTSFQSRLGRDPWLRPYTDHTVEELAKSGTKKLLVICPAFVTDCLETIEEIAGENAEHFKKHGGESLKLIPCLNEHPAFIDFLAKRINKWAD